MTDTGEPQITLELVPDSLRKCGSCTLCCKLVPVRELEKAAGERCEHQRHTGCRIYPDRPPSCRFWNCRWLAGAAADTAELSRPDRAHYVIDVTIDYCTARNHENGERIPFPVVQVWCDPDYPDAHRDPALRAFLARRGREGYAAIIRYSSSKAFVLMPPAMSSTHDFVEVTDTKVHAEREHSLAHIADVLSGKAEPWSEQS